jgi:hypothetical protein
MIIITYIIFIDKYKHWTRLNHLYYKITIFIIIKSFFYFTKLHSPANYLHLF